jgi:hypothetical protein
VVVLASWLVLLGLSNAVVEALVVDDVVLVGRLLPVRVGVVVDLVVASALSDAFDDVPTVGRSPSSLAGSRRVSAGGDSRVFPGSFG